LSAVVGDSNKSLSMDWAELGARFSMNQAAGFGTDWYCAATGWIIDDEG
jgi:hypothetical protein